MASPITQASTISDEQTLGEGELRRPRLGRTVDKLMHICGRFLERAVLIVVGHTEVTPTVSPVFQGDVDNNDPRSRTHISSHIPGPNFHPPVHPETSGPEIHIHLPSVYPTAHPNFGQYGQYNSSGIPGPSIQHILRPEPVEFPPYGHHTANHEFGQYGEYSHSGSSIPGPSIRPIAHPEPFHFRSYNSLLCPPVIPETFPPRAPIPSRIPLPSVDITSIQGPIQSRPYVPSGIAGPARPRVVNREAFRDIKSSLLKSLQLPFQTTAILRLSEEGRQLEMFFLANQNSIHNSVRIPVEFTTTYGEEQYRLGWLYLRQFRLQDSEMAFIQAILLFESLDMPIKVADIRSKLGQVYIEQERFVDAIELLVQALTVHLDANLVYFALVDYMLLAQASFHQRKLSEAYDFLEEGAVLTNNRLDILSGHEAEGWQRWSAIASMMQASIHLCWGTHLDHVQDLFENALSVFHELRDEYGFNFAKSVQHAVDQSIDRGSQRFPPSAMPPRSHTPPSTAPSLAMRRRRRRPRLV